MKTAKGTVRRIVVAAACLSMGLAGAGRLAADTQLLDLPGDHSMVRYTPGALARASTVQTWMGYIAEDYSTWSKRPTRLGAIVIDREQWVEMEIVQPYGLPASLGGGRIALPAYGDEDTVRRWRKLLGGTLPMATDSPVRGTADEAASLLAADHLGHLEVARQLVPISGLHPQESWVTDVLAHLTVLSALDRFSPAAGADLALFYQQLARVPAGPLSEYRDGLGFPEWLAFQARFFQAAEAIASQERKPLRALIRLEQKHGGRLTAAALYAEYPQLPGLLAPPATTAPVQPSYVTPD
ncbi:MAG: hypothetical protein K8J08_06010 [Thermoanaerobaculia bacterium]|nr:hypothetical protein [Thermoanaerobaculia bacterium]